MVAARGTVPRLGHPRPQPAARRVNVPDSRVLSLWSAISITETHEGIRTQIEINAEEPASRSSENSSPTSVLPRPQLLYRLRVVDSEDILTRDAATVRFDCGPTTSC